MVARISFENGYELEVIQESENLYTVYANFLHATEPRRVELNSGYLSRGGVTLVMETCQSVMNYSEDFKKRFTHGENGQLMERSKEAKNDRIDNKVRWELMPLSLLNEIAKVYTVGAEKYGANTWQDLENGYERYKAAALRHIISYEEGEQADPETGLHPLAHAAWNMIACLYFGLKKEE